MERLLTIVLKKNRMEIDVVVETTSVQLLQTISGIAKNTEAQTPQSHTRRTENETR